MIKAFRAFCAVLTHQRGERLLIIQGPQEWSDSVRLEAVILARELDERQMALEGNNGG